MGLYDSFYADPPMRCRECDSEIKEFQTKALSGELHEIVMRQPLPQFRHGLHIANGLIPCYGYCPRSECKEPPILAWAVIEDGDFVRLTTVGVRLPQGKHWGMGYWLADFLDWHAPCRKASHDRVLAKELKKQGVVRYGRKDLLEAGPKLLQACKALVSNPVIRGMSAHIRDYARQNAIPDPFQQAEDAIALAESKEVK